MRVIIAGGSGFLGQALQRRLQGDGHAVGILTRAPAIARQEEIAWNPDGTAGDWAAALDGADAVINLAGAGVADRRWTASRKQLLRNSRVLSTRSLVTALRVVSRPPAVFVNGSAVGYYGPHGDEIVTEATPPGQDFLAQLAVDWEDEAGDAALVTRLALIRTGIVLHPDGGALAKLLLPFKFGAGGPLGSGAQYMPWIHLDDWLDLMLWLVTDPRAMGPFNGTAPNPVTNAEFTTALAQALHRPAFIPVPPVGLRLLLGEFAETLLTGQRALPARAMEMGFTFRYQDLAAALHHLLAQGG